MPAPPSAPESANAPLPASRPPARSIPESLPLLLFILVTPHLSFAAPHPSAVSDPGEPVIITALTFEIENGRTSEKALRRFISVTEGRRFDSLQSARTALNRDIQELINLRVFRSVEAELQPAEGGHPQYQIIYRIVDTFTFIPIPLVLYSSNAGGPQILYIQIWDNMFGSLIDWFSIASITLRPDGSGGVETDTAEKLGEPIRGIPDAAMDGSFALYLNQTLGIGLWQWKGVWDLQIHPWFDLALAHGGTRPFTTANDIRRSLGADILLFIERVPNLVFRFSWGFDLDPAVPWSRRSKREFIVQYSYSY